MVFLSLSEGTPGVGDDEDGNDSFRGWLLGSCLLVVAYPGFCFGFRGIFLVSGEIGKSIFRVELEGREKEGREGKGRVILNW